MIYLYMYATKLDAARPIHTTDLQAFFFFAEQPMAGGGGGRP